MYMLLYMLFGMQTSAIDLMNDFPYYLGLSSIIFAWVVMDVSFEISSMFTMMLSAPMSQNWSSHTGTLSLVFHFNPYIRSISTAAIYWHTIISNVIWVEGHCLGGITTSFSCIFFIFWVTVSQISKGSDSSRILRSDLLVPSFRKSSLCRFPCSGSLVLSKEIFQTICRGMIRLGFFPHQYYDLPFKFFNSVL